jgi:hypothetical protein
MAPLLHRISVSFIGLGAIGLAFTFLIAALHYLFNIPSHQVSGKIALLNSTEVFEMLTNVGGGAVLFLGLGLVGSAIFKRG